MDSGEPLQAHEGWLLVRVLVIGLILVVFCAIFGPYAHYILKRCRRRPRNLRAQVRQRC